MPVPVLPVVGALAAVATVVVLLQVLERRRRAARRDELARDAVRRGWRHTVADQYGSRIDRFQGTGMTGSWTADVVERRGRKRPGVRLVRWWNGAVEPSPALGPVVLLLPIGNESGVPLDRVVDGARGAGTFARLAQRAVQSALALGIDHHFGALADLRGRELYRIDTEAPLVEGFAVLADQPEEARRRLTPGLLGVLRQAFPLDGWDGRAIARPWITIAGDRIAIACVSHRLPQAADVAALAEAGSTVARWRD